jgi:hypothetical protein
MPAPREENEKIDSGKSPGAKKKSKKSKSPRRNLALFLESNVEST